MLRDPENDIQGIRSTNEAVNQIIERAMKDGTSLVEKHDRPLVEEVLE
jgi:hypothetical protein